MQKRFVKMEHDFDIQCFFYHIYQIIKIWLGVHVNEIWYRKEMVNRSSDITTLQSLFLEL